MKAKDLKDKVKWRKISKPDTWRPKPGEELIGFYMGRSKRDGMYGQYEVLMVAVPYKGTYMISGTSIIQLADSAMLGRGDAVRIVFKENLPLESPEPVEEGARPRYVKVFELYVGEVERSDDLPLKKRPRATRSHLSGYRAVLPLIDRK